MSFPVPLFRRYRSIANRFQPRWIATAILAVVGAVLLSPDEASAQAIVRTWTGGGTTSSFSDFNNWNSSFTPGTNLNLQFDDAAGSGLTLNVDLTNGTPGIFELQSLLFQNDNAVTATNFILTGNTLYFSNLASSITVTTTAAAGAQRTMTINNQVQIGNGVTLSLVSNGSNTNALRINGGISLASGASAGALLLAGTSTNGQNLITGSIINNDNIQIIKQGAGRWELSGANTFAGGVSMQAGTLVFSGLNTISGGVKQLAGTMQFNTAATIFGGTTLTAGTMTFLGNSTINDGVIVSGGTLILSGSNFINEASGGVNVRGGVLQARNVNALGGVTTVSLGNGTTNGTLSFSNGVATTQSQSIIIMGTGVAAANGGTIASDATSAAATVTFNGTVSHGVAANQVLNLGGNNPGVNTFETNFGNGTGGTFGLNKNGATTWELTGNNTFNGGVTITQGQLRIGPLSDGTLASRLNWQAGGNNLRFNTAAGNVGVLETSGVFNATLGSGAGQVQFVLSGGWSAFGGSLDVSLNGGSAITWGGTAAPGILGTSTELDLNSVQSNDVVRFTNPITGAAANRVVRVTDNPSSTTDRAEMTGVITVNGLTKAGTGYLELTANNAVSGGLTINGGVLRLTNTSTIVNLATLPLRFTGVTTTGAILETSGSFTETLGIVPGTVSWISTTGAGGFSARGGDLNVNIGGSGATLNWGATNFVNSGELQFGSMFADSVVTFTNPLNLGSGTRTIRVFDNATTTDDYAVLSGLLSGAAGLNKQGPGTLVLTSDNTYTGITTAGGGMLRLGNGGTTGSVAGAIVNLSNVTFSYGSGTAKTYAGVISGNGSVEMNSAADAILTLNAANTYTGRTTITGGTLRLGAAGSLSALTQMTINTTGTFDVNGRVTTLAALNGNGNLVNTGGATTLTINAAVASTFTGNILETSGGTHALTLAKSGAQTLTLGGTNTYSGETRLVTGTLFVQSPAALGSSTAISFTNAALATSGNQSFSQSINLTGTTTGTAVFQSDALMQINGPVFFGGAGNRVITFTSLTPETSTLRFNNTITVAESGFSGTTRVLTLGGNAPIFVNGVIAMGASAPMVSVVISNTSAGGVTFAADNTFFGRTTINAGNKLFIGTGGSTGILSNTAAVAAGGQIIFNHDFIQTYTGVIAGAGGVLINGPPTGGLRYDKVQTYSGGTTVQQGTLTYGLANALTTTGMLALGLTGTVDFNGFNATVAGLNDFSGGGGGHIVNSGLTPVTLTANVTNSTATLVYSGSIDGGLAGLGFQKFGAGSQTLSGNNSFALNSTIAGGTLVAGSDSALGTASWFVSGAISGTGAGEMRTVPNTVFSFTNGLTVNGSYDITFNRVVGFAGNRSITVSNTGQTIFNTIEFSDTATARTLTMNIGGPTLVYTLTDGLAANVGSGNLNINFSGGNRMEIASSDTNIYMGVTTLAGSGTLYVNQPGGLGDTAFNIGRGATLQIGPAGSIQNNSRPVTINGGGTVLIDPGGEMKNGNNTINVNTGGLIIVNGTTGGGTISVNGSGILTGTGIIQGPINLSSGGTYRISGDSVGQAMVANLTTNGGVLEYQLGDPLDPFASDSIFMLGGTPPLNTDVIFRLLPQAGFGIGSYKLIGDFYSAPLAGTLRINTAISGYSFNFLNPAGTLTLQVTQATGTNLTWRGNVSSNWNTTEANWVNPDSAAVAYSETNHDFALFDDTALSTDVVLQSEFSPGNMVFSNNTKTISLFGDKITGTTGLSVIGNGRVILANDNDFTGITQINAGGTLQLGAGGAAGSIAANNTIGNDGTLVFNRSTNLAFNGTIYGFGQVYLQGAGTLTLGGQNVFTGGLTVNAGSLHLSGTGNYPTVGNVTVNGGVLNYDGAAQTTETLNVLGGTANVSAASLNANVINVNGGTLSLIGSATFVDANVNLQSGVINLLTAPLNTSNLVFGGGPVNSTGVININSTEQLVLRSNLSYTAVNNASIDGGGAVIQSIIQGAGGLSLGATRTFAINDSANTTDELTIDVPLSAGAFGIIKTGAGTLYLKGANNLTGANTLNAGTLKLDHSTALGTGALQVTSTSTLQGAGTAITLNNVTTMSGNLIIGGSADFHFLQPLTAAGASRTLFVNNTGLTEVDSLLLAEVSETTSRSVTIAGSGAIIINSISSVASTQGSLIVNGPIVTLANDNTYNGLTSIQNGTVFFGTQQAFGAAGNTTDIQVATTTGSVNPKILATAAITLNRNFDVNINPNGSSTFGSIITAGTAEFAGGITLSQSITMTSALGGTVLFSGPLTGPTTTAGIIKAGPGDVLISGASNSWSGPSQINAGTLRLVGGNNRLSTTADLAVDLGAILDLNNNSQMVNQLLNGGAGGGTITNSQTGLSVLSVNAGTWGGTISNGAGTVALLKNGTGTLTLNGSQTYSGATTVAGGVLVVDGALGATAVHVDAAARMLGNGTIAGSITSSGAVTGNWTLAGALTSSGTINAGGTSVAGQLTMNSLVLNGGTIVFDLGDPNLAGSSDTLLVSNLPTLNLLTNLTFNPLSDFDAGVYTLMSGYGAGTFSDLSKFSFAADQFGFHFLLKNNPGSLDLEITQNFNSVTWVGGAAGNPNLWDTVTANWNGDATVFTNGLSVATFGNGTSVNAVTVEAAGVQPQNMIVTDDATHNYVFSGGAITSAGSLTKSGGGTLTFLNAASFAGGASIGTGGTLIIGNNGTVGSFTGDINNSGTVVFDRATASPLTYADSISGSGTVRIDHGIITFGGANNFTGTTTIAAGARLIVGGSIAGNVSVASTGTMSFAGNQSYGSVISGAGIVTVDSGLVTITQAQIYTGGTIIFPGATLSLAGPSGALAATGNITNSGTLSLARSMAFPVNVMTGGGGVAIDAGTVTLNSAQTYTGGTSVASGATLQFITGGSVVGNISDSGTVSIAYPTTFGNSISGIGTVSIDAIGMVTFTNNQSYTGRTTIAAGATLVLGGTLGSLTGDVTNSGKLNFDRSQTYSAVISGDGEVNINVGAVTFQQAQSYTGVTKIANGQQLNLGGALSGNVAFNGTTGTLSINGTQNYDKVISGQGSVNITAGTVTFSQPQTYSGGTTINSGARLILGTSAGSVSGAILDNGTFSFARGGTFSFTNTINGSGKVTIDTGTVTFEAAQGYGGGTSIAAGATLILGGAAGAISGDVTNSGTLNFGRTLTYGGAINGIGGVAVSAGTLTLNGTQTYTGGTAISSNARLILGGTILGDVSVASTGTLSFANTQTFAGTISGAGNVTVDSGIVTFQSAQTYNGITSIATGAKLVLGGSAGAVAGSITNAGTLSLARTMTFANSVTGNGGVSIDSGVVTFTAAQTYNGGTNIASGATLVLAGTAGSVVGNITNDGTLSIAYATTFGNSVSGAGGVSIDAAGTVEFTANQNYNGKTTIAAGAALTLKGPAGSLTGGVVNAGTLNFDRTQIYGGVIEGGGTVNINNGPVTFNAAQTYDGTTNIAASAQLILGGSGGSLAGDVVNSGTLSFNRTQSYDKVISGVGAVTITSGTVTFSKAQTYGGGTTINSGAALVLGSSAGSVAGSILNNGTLSFGYGFTFTNTINGTGKVTVDAGTVTFAATQGYNGGTSIAAGARLILGGANGAISGPVTNSGTLSFARTQTYGGSIDGIGNVTIDAGTVTFNANQTYTGGTAVAAGAKLILGGTILNNVSVAGTGTLAFGASQTFNGTISGAGNVAVEAGNVVFAGDQTYNGKTVIAAATSLQLGSAGTGGQLASDVTNDGVLTFSGGSVVYSGAISGNGNVAVNSGPVTFLGTNTYAGTTSIAATATLNIGNGGAAGSLSGNVTNSGVLAFNRNNSAALTYGGNITGIGGVSINGGGTIKFTGDNNYGNGTTIIAGTLQIGNGSNAGSVGGLIANSGVLAFARNDVTTFTNSITGGGAVSVVSGTVQFTGASNYTGATTIAANAGLKLNDGGSLSSASYAIAGSLTISNSINVAYNNTVLGNGSFIKDGLGSLTLAGNGAGYAGTTTVAAGTLVVNGTLGNGAVAVANGATLAGNGTIAGVVTSSGAILPSGSTIGTLTLGGLVLNGGSLNFTLNTVGSSDRIFLTTTIAPTAGVDINLVLNGTGSFGLGDYSLISWNGTNQMNATDFAHLILSSSTLNGLNIALENKAGFVNLKVTAVTANNIHWVGNTNNVWDGVVANWDGDALTFTNNVSSVTFTDSGTNKNVAVDMAGVRPQHMTVDNSAGVANVYTFSGGDINALGGLTKLGAGTVVFDNNVTFASDVVLSNGVIQIGNGGSSGSIDGDIANSGIVDFNRSGTLPYTGVISGIGAVSVRGGLTLVLTGSNSYSGKTTIASGSTVQVGNGGNTGQIVGDVVNSGTLAFNRTDSFAYGGVISGGGTVEVRTGIVSFTSAQTYTGITSIAGGATLILGGSSGALTGSVTNDGTLNFAHAQTYDGIVSGGGNVVVSAGTVTFNNANTYTGGTAVASGATLILGGSAGAIAGDVTNAGTVTFARSQTYGGVISGAGNVSISSADVTFTNAQTYNGGTAISAAAKLTLGGTAGSLTGDVNNAGTLSFARTQTYGGSITGAGSVTVDAGTVTFTNANNYGGGTSVAATARLILGGSAGSLTGNIANAGTVSFARTQAYGGSITGAGNVTIDAGDVTFNNANNYGGGTSISAGASLTLGGASGAITGNVTNSGTLNFARTDTVTFGGVIDGIGAVNVTGGMTLVLTGANTYTGPTGVVSSTLQIGAGGTAGSIQSDIANNGLVVFNRSDVTPYAGVISGSGAVSVQGGVTLVLTGANTYTGMTTVVSGTLQLGNGGGSGSVSGNIANADKVVFNRNATPYTYGGVISGAGTVNIVAGDVTFTADQTYSGVTTIAGGATLHLGTASSAAGNLSSGGVVNAGTLSFDKTSGSNLYGGAISGPGAVRIADSAHWQFSANQTYGGVTTVGNSADLTLRSGANLTGSVSLGTGASLTFFQGTKIYSGAVSGAGSVAITGAADVTLLGANTYAGPTTIDSGSILRIGAGGNLGSVGGNITNAGTLFVNRSNAYSIDGVISGGGGFVQAGSGATTLNGANLYTGATSVAGGTLTVAGSLANTPVTIASGAALNGNGSLGGTVTVLSGAVLSGSLTVSGQVSSSGTLSPNGVATGVLNIGSLALHGGSINFNLNAPGSNDRIFSAALPTIDAAVNLVYSNLSAGIYTLFNGYTSSIANFNLFTSQSTIGSFGLTLNNNNGSVTLEVVQNGNNIGWTGGNGTWDYSTPNFGGDASTFADGDNVTFGNTGTPSTVTIIAGGVSPGSVLIDNDAASPYTFQGGPIKGTGYLTKQGVGAVTFNNANTYTGGTTMNGGTFTLASGGSIVNTGNVAVISGTLTVAAGGAINGSGTTFVNGGTLVNNNTVSGAIVVNNGGLYKGTGGGSTVTLNAGGTWSPGNSVNMQATGDMDATWNAQSQLVIEFRNAGGNTPGADWDLIDLGTGILHIDANNVVAGEQIKLFVSSYRFLNDGPGGGAGDSPNGFNDAKAENGAAPQQYFWKFLAVDSDGKIAVDDPSPGSVGGRFLVIDNGVDGVFNDGIDPTNPFTRPVSSMGQGTFRVMTGQELGVGYSPGLYLVYSAIPEPSSFILSGLASLAGGWYGRRRLKKAKAEAAAKSTISADEQVA